MKTLTEKQYRDRVAKRSKIVAATYCPDCGAVVGARCWKDRDPLRRRRSPHIERVRLYQEKLKSPCNQLQETS